MKSYLLVVARIFGNRWQVYLKRGILFLWGDDMKIGIIQGTSQIDKNSILYECTKEYGEVTNFGCFENEDNYSYVEISL